MLCLGGETSAQYCYLILTLIYNTTLFQNDLTFSWYAASSPGGRDVELPSVSSYLPKYEQAYLFVFIF